MFPIFKFFGYSRNKTQYLSIYPAPLRNLPFAIGHVAVVASQPANKSPSPRRAGCAGLALLGHSQNSALGPRQVFTSVLEEKSGWSFDKGHTVWNSGFWRDYWILGSRGD